MERQTQLFKEGPTISVILPTHNRPGLLAEAIASVKAQTMADGELLVVDDASSPPAEVPSDGRIRVIRHAASRGGADAKNSGAKAARGEFIAFLDDDDLLANDYLQSAVSSLRSHPELGGVFMGVKWFGSRGDVGQAAYDLAMEKVLGLAGGRSAEDDLIVFEPRQLAEALLHSVPMAFQRPVFRTTLRSDISEYQADILLWDCDWAIRAATTAPFGLINRGLYLQRADGQGYSSKRDRREEHAHSNQIMKERLLASTSDPQMREAVCRSLAELWFDRAWHHAKDGRFAQARRYCITSISYSLRSSTLKLLLRSLLRIR